MRSRNEMQSALFVKIDNEQSYYQPGDRITGRVELTLSKEAVIGSIDVELSGQARSKIVQSNGQAESIFKDKLCLFQTNLKLYDGHYKHKNGVFLWPFEFCVPEAFFPSEPQTSLWQRQNQQQEINSRQLSYPLPPSFRFEHSIVGKAWYASITYKLTASMSDPGEGSLLGPQKPKTCVRTICIRPKIDSDPIDIDDPSQRRGVSTSCTVRTLRLAPEQSESFSYLRQKAQSLFCSASLPRFTFEVDVSYPTRVQAYNSEPVPFIIAVSPRTEAALTTIHPSLVTFYRYPSVLLKQFTLILEASTECHCPSIANDICATSSYDILLAKAHFNDLRLIMRSTASDQKIGLEENAPTSVDLGRYCNVRITDEFKGDSNAKGRKEFSFRGLMQTQKTIAPSLETCLVARRYWFRWEVEFLCAEEKVVLKGRSPSEVTILAPLLPREQSLSENLHWTHAPSDEMDINDERSCDGSSEDLLPAYSAISTDNLSVNSIPSRTCKVR